MAFKFSFKLGKRLPVLSGILCLVFGSFLPSNLKAQQALYQNTSDSEYFSPPTSGNNYPPQIDATAFDNESIFSVTFKAAGTSTLYYETSDTLYYTNGDNGIMIGNAPVVTNLLNGVFLTSQSYGIGYKFDYKYSGGNKQAGTFYNSGTIRCNSILDGNNTYNLGGIFGLVSFAVSVGQCYINATNVYNPGNIDIGVNGGLFVNGQNIDLSRSVLNIEPALQNFIGGSSLFNSLLFNNNVTLTSTGGFGTDTNSDWNPGGIGFGPGGVRYPLTLSPTNAFSSYPDYLLLTNSTSYFRQDLAGPNNVIIRAVFVQNDSPNAPYNVYIQPNTIGTALAGQGTAVVEWVGNYTDPATGYIQTNYLYLTDDFLLGASTNVVIIPGPGNNGYPDNFTFSAFSSPQLSNSVPTPSGFPFGAFANAAITNAYAYMNGQIVPSSVVTNGPVTNMLGRIQINATRELNLNNAIVSGPNYLSIQATNQFDGSAGAQIAAPYADINVGVTNGSLSISNLLESAIPNWNGTVQAWSTRWLALDPVTGFTNDFRVLLVHSHLVPTTQPWVQNLKLHTGKDLFISDVLNVYGSFFSDAQNISVTTNGIGYGSTSTDGELNSYIPGDIGPVQMPNLKNLTNNGAIRSQGLFVFSNLNNFINGGLVTDSGTVMFSTNFVNAGVISNGLGNFNLQSVGAILTNGSIIAAGKIALSANSMILSNENLQCLSLVLNPTNLISDMNGVLGNTNNGNLWVVGRTNGTGGGGFSLLNNPKNGDLLGTTITNICPSANKLIANTWSGTDFGAVNRGFSNNVALGKLVLDVLGGSSLITFTGTGTNTALYVDSIEFRDVLTNGVNTSYDFTNWLSLNTNITIYFAQATINGISVAEKINNASIFSGKNGGRIVNGVVTPGRLRWVPTYAGLFSATNEVVAGVTNTYNTALAQSTSIDSDGDGIVNAYDPQPFLLLPPGIYASQLNFTITSTNRPVKNILLAWNVPWNVPYSASNSVFFTTSLLNTNWQLYTNFVSANSVGSPFQISVSDTNTLKGIRFYKVLVQPLLTYPN